MAKILLVEDDAFLKEVYFDTLKSAGYEVEIAEDGAEALSKIRQGGWDLILIDIIIPKINGLEVIEQVKKNPPVDENKIIVFLTNLDKAEERERASELGDEYIIKSDITPGDLIEKVKSYLAQLD